MKQTTDTDVWNQFTQPVKPLSGKTDKHPREFPPQIHVYRVPKRELLFELDLHGYTLEEAYNAVKSFIDLHYKKESKQIKIITGKGINQLGKIKSEIELWLETPVFSHKIRETKWINSGGVLQITLKRNKQK